jgi:hypothetical protein
VQSLKWQQADRSQQINKAAGQQVLRSGEPDAVAYVSMDDVSDPVSSDVIGTASWHSSTTLLLSPDVCISIS